MTIAYFQIFQSDEDLGVSVWNDSEEAEFVREGEWKTIKKAFRAIYDSIEAKDQDSWEKCQVDHLSQILVEPAAALLRRADHIAFILEKESIRFALDLLKLDGEPLYTICPISYLVDEIEIEQKPGLALDNAFCMADLSCDPEKGLKSAAALFQEADYVEMPEATLAEVIAGGSDTTALILSAHGEVDEEESGSLGINDEEFKSEAISELDVDLVYLDSCQMGSAWDVVEACQTEETVSYYLAPITSNDAGDSSTLTVTWFFAALKSSGNPAHSLFETKQKLRKHYEGQGLESIAILNKAFPFRLYEFGSGDA